MKKKKVIIEITPRIKQYLIKRIGKDETKKLLYFMKMGNYIMLTGPSTTGKTTIRDILLGIGYPYVIDDAGLGRVVECNIKINEDLKPRSDILSELGIEPKHRSADMDHLRDWTNSNRVVIVRG